MAKTLSNKFDSFQLISLILLIGYLCLGFVPNLQAVDKIAPQWVGMTLLICYALLFFSIIENQLKKLFPK